MSEELHEDTDQDNDLPGPEWLAYHPFLVWLRSKPNNKKWGAIRFTLFLAVMGPIAAIGGAGIVVLGYVLGCVLLVWIVVYAFMESIRS